MIRNMGFYFIKLKRKSLENVHLRIITPKISLWLFNKKVYHEIHQKTRPAYRDRPTKTKNQSVIM